MRYQFYSTGSEEGEGQGVIYPAARNPLPLTRQEGEQSQTITS